VSEPPEPGCGVLGLVALAFVLVVWVFAAVGFLNVLQGACR